MSYLTIGNVRNFSTGLSVCGVSLGWRSKTA
jgi:hypothetical protein